MQTFLKLMIKLVIWWKLIVIYPCISPDHRDTDFKMNSSTELPDSDTYESNNCSSEVFDILNFKSSAKSIPIQPLTDRLKEQVRFIFCSIEKLQFLL